MSVERIITEPLRCKAGAAARTGASALRTCCVPWPSDRKPAPLSARVLGGQRQRIGSPALWRPRPVSSSCDEAVSALDVSIQAQIVNLLRRLRTNSRVLSLHRHDLSVVRHISSRVAVMYLGRSWKSQPRPPVRRTPAHPLYPALLASCRSPIRAPAGRRAAPRGRTCPTRWTPLPVASSTAAARTHAICRSEAPSEADRRRARGRLPSPAVTRPPCEAIPQLPEPPMNTPPYQPSKPRRRRTRHPPNQGSLFEDFVPETPCPLARTHGTDVDNSCSPADDEHPPLHFDAAWCAGAIVRQTAGHSLLPCRS